MTVAALVPVGEYLSTSYRPDCEYLDGVILERHLGERDHSTLQKRLTMHFGNRETELGVEILPEQRVQVTPTRFRVPDLCIVEAAGPVEPIVRVPPLLCIEILSKDDTMSEMQERIDDYLQFGVPDVWVIDPRKRRAWHFTAAGMREAHDKLQATGHDIVLPLADIFD